MKLQQLYSYTRKAIDDYQLIEKGDMIAVGISGGKDSLTLLYALAGLRRFYPFSFEIIAVTVDLGYDKFVENIFSFCKDRSLHHWRRYPYDCCHKERTCREKMA